MGDLFTVLFSYRVYDLGEEESLTRLDEEKWRGDWKGSNIHFECRVNRGIIIICGANHLTFVLINVRFCVCVCFWVTLESIRIRFGFHDLLPQHSPVVGREEEEDATCV